jgi:ribose transport system substrate-binding protein
MDKAKPARRIRRGAERTRARRWRARGIAAAAALAAATSLAVGGGSAEDGGRLAFFGFGANNGYTQAAWKAAEEQAKKDGLSIRFFDGQFSGPTQYSQIQDALASGQYKALLIMPVDGASLTPLVKQAYEKKVKVFSLEHTIGPDPTDFRPQVDGLTPIGYSVPDDAKMIAEYVVERCAKLDPCRVVLMYGDRTTLFDQTRANAVKEVFAKHPNIKVLATVDGHYLPDKSMSAMSDVLSAKGDDIDIIASPSGDQQIDGAERVLKQRNVTRKIVLVGQGGGQIGVSRVRDGAWATTQIHLPATIGRMAAEFAAKNLRGEEIPKMVNLTGHSPVGDMATQESLKEHPEFKGEWGG